MPPLSWAVRRARDLIGLEAVLMRATELTVAQRGRLLVDRYAAMAAGTGSMPFLGHTFHYDNRLMPALMPAYLEEIRRLDRIVDLSRATVIDVGANVGQFGATVTWRFPRAHVWSFEPNEEIYPLLLRNASQSPHWMTFPIGIGEEEETVSFWVVPGKSGQGSTLKENATADLVATEAEERHVKLAPLTAGRLASLGAMPSVDLLKVDVEGAEASALRGLRDVRWRYLSIETSLGRDGGLNLDETLELAAGIWGQRPLVRWRSDAPAGAATVDAILEIPPTSPI